MDPTGCERCRTTGDEIATSIIGERRRPFFRDRDGILSVTIGADETDTHTLDWSDRLGTDTIATSTWTADGPTVASSSNTTTTATAKFSGTGTLTNTVVTAGGLTLVQEIRVYQSPPAESEDYA
jgi:hypothetical protein